MGSKKKKKQPQTFNNEANNDKQPPLSKPINEALSSTSDSIGKEVQSLPLEELYNTGFKVIPVEISSQTTFDSNSSDSFTSTHYCYFKKHESRTTTNNNSIANLLPPDNTLFITNLPVDSTEAHIKYLFQECGVINRIIFNGIIKDGFLINIFNENDDNRDGNNNNPNNRLNGSVQGKKSKKRKKKNSNVQGGIEGRVIGKYEEGELRKLLAPGSSAHIIFQEPEGVKKAFEMTKKKRIWNAEPPPLGLSRWLQDYRLYRSDQTRLQEEVDEYMLKFEEAELERHKALEAKLNQPDEDGFITVTRVGRRNTNTDGTITVTAAKAEEIRNLKPKNKELADFYRFQMREAKRNKLIDLRKKFEEDKEKIAKLKAARRFRPY